MDKKFFFLHSCKENVSPSSQTHCGDVSVTSFIVSILLTIITLIINTPPLKKKKKNESLEECLISTSVVQILSTSYTLIVY